MKEVRNNPKIDSNAPAKDTTRHPKRSHNALDIGPKKKFKPMAMAPIQAMERNKKHNLNVWRNMLLFLSRAWSGGNFCVLPRWIDPRPYAYHHPNASHSKSISCKCYVSLPLKSSRSYPYKDFNLHWTRIGGTLYTRYQGISKIRASKGKARTER